MRFGIVILPDERRVEALRRWRRAEEYGFDHAWTYDHLGWRELVDEPWFDAVPTLAAAALVTSRIRVGTLVSSPNFRHPVCFAREVTALDDLSNGRFTLGVGVGGSGFDATVLGNRELSPGQRVRRFAEFVEVLDRILRNDRTTWHGEYYTSVDARSTPGCLQLPRVPFVVAANGPQSMRLAARFGEGWVTAGPWTDTTQAWWKSVEESAHRFDDALASGDRDPHTVQRHLSLISAPVFSLASVNFFTDVVGRAEELGFTDVITHWPRASGWYAGDESVLEAVAADVLPTFAE